MKKLWFRAEDDQVAVIEELQQSKGLSQGAAIRTLIDLGRLRTGELPEGFSIGYVQGLSEGRTEGIRKAITGISRSFAEDDDHG